MRNKIDYRWAKMNFVRYEDSCYYYTKCSDDKIIIEIPKNSKELFINGDYYDEYRTFIKCPLCQKYIEVDIRQGWQSYEKTLFVYYKMKELEKRITQLEFSPPSIDGGPEFLKILKEAKQSGDF